MMELPYKVNGNPVFVDDEVYPVAYKTSTDKFKYKGNNVTGLYYDISTNKGQKRAFGDNYYYTANNQKNLINIAQEGTYVMGGKPNYLITTTGWHYLKLLNGKLILDDSVTLHQYSINVPYIKFYGMACAGGGGGANNEGSGGSAGGTAFFPMILFPNDIITIYIGAGGNQASDTDDTGVYSSGDSGMATLLYFGKVSSSESIDLTKVFIECHGGGGGLPGNRGNNNTPEVGSARTFFSTTNSVHSSYKKWIDTLEASTDLLYTYSYKTAENQSTIFCASYAGGAGGGGNKSGNANGTSPGQIQTKRSDCYYAFTQYYITDTGEGYNSSNIDDFGKSSYTSGGGASAFYGSKGGNGGKKVISSSTKDFNLRGNDGKYGGGGGSGGYNRIGAFDLFAYAGGKGGDGCVALWYGAKEGNITIDTSEG